ncbi:MAG: hypothetical protein ACOCTM_04255 [Bacteroidota bacterium]
MKTAEDALQSVLDFCQGYESGSVVPGSDYHEIKSFVKQKMQEYRGQENVDVESSRMKKVPDNGKMLDPIIEKMDYHLAKGNIDQDDYDKMGDMVNGLYRYLEEADENF